MVVSGDLIPVPILVQVLAAWECFIGIGLIVGRGLRVTLLLLYVQILGRILDLRF